jgi:hypothetical protein
MPRATEDQIAFATVQIAAAQANGIATFRMLRRGIPTHVHLSAADTAQSLTRPNEQMWEQQIRNIQSHHGTTGNYIFEGYLTHVPGVGYAVTRLGRGLLTRAA